MFSLSANDGPAFKVHGEGRLSPYLVVCDHASNRIPACLGDLGLTEAQRLDHIAWDPGTEGMGRHLADLLACPAVIGGFSRLVLDLNRLPDHPEQIPPISDGVVIAPNQGLSEADKAARRDALFWPYQNEIARRLSEIEARGEAPQLISLHSFTPQLAHGGQPRPWHVGILWKDDARLAGPVMAALKARGDMVVGDNEPYDRRQYRTQTVEVHGEDLGRLNLLVEVRQDLLKTEADERNWAEIIHAALPFSKEAQAA